MIIALPGMGADSRMYGRLWHDIPSIRFIDWPLDYLPSSVPDLAREIASGINAPVDCIIGSSMGGMVGLELASLVGCRRVVLVGSAINSDEIAPLLRLIAPIAHVTPLKLCTALAGKSPGMLSAMFSEQNPAFIRSMISAVMTWKSQAPRHSPDSRDI